MASRLYGILLIAALVVVSGVIAYVGDIVGRRMGRKRLSLFGLRPRHTAIVISVISGMLITAFTLTAAMLASRNVRDGFLNMGEMRRQQHVLQAQKAELTSQVRKADAEVRARKADVEARKRELQAAQLARDGARAQLGDTKSDLARTQQNLEERQKQLARAEQSYAAARRRLKVATRAYNDVSTEKARLQQDVTRTTWALATDRATKIAVGANQTLGTELIRSGQSKPAIRGQLNRFIGRLNDTGRARLPRPTGGGDPVLVRKAAYDPAKKQPVWFDRDRIVDQLCDVIQQANCDVIVRAYSSFNTYEGEPIYADFELFRNRLVFRRGEVLARAVLPSSDSQWVLLNQLVALLKRVGETARANNMMPQSTPTETDPFGASDSTVGKTTYPELGEKVDEIRRLTGSARVTVLAADDAWTIGPLKVSIRVEPGR